MDFLFLCVLNMLDVSEVQALEQFLDFDIHKMGFSSDRIKMNFLFKKSASMAASKQTLTALMSTEVFHFAPSISKHILSNNHVCTSACSCSSNHIFPNPRFDLHRRAFHVSASPLRFRASDVVRAQYAVDDFSDDEKTPAKKAGAGNDEGLEIAKLGIAQDIVTALAKKGITSLFPIQRAVLVPAMKGRDMIGRARTGTGKTLAFGIPILDKIIQFNDKHGRGRNPLALVLAPTRELARQVEKEFRESAPVLDTICVYGGVPISSQMRTLDHGVDIVVGTPGRIIDLIKRGSLNLSEVQFVVLDEADQMLAVGFDEDVEVILEKLPKNRQGMMFSATMPTWIRKLTQKYLKDPLTIDLVGDSDQKLADGITLYSIASEMYGKSSILGPLITEHGKGGKCIVFTQTKRDADRLAAAMGRSFRCEALHGDISQNQRERTLAGFRDGDFNVLIATDVAARGLDVPNVDLIVHYELPSTSEIFVHRSGRTGRAGKKGIAILMHTDQQSRAVQVIERDVGCRFKELPRIPVKDGGHDMLGDMGGGRFGGGRMSESGFGRSGGYGGSNFGRSGGYGGSSSSGRSGGYGGSSSGRSGGYGGFSSSGRSRSGYGESGSGRFGSFGGSSGFGGRSSDSGSGRSSSGFGDFGSGKSSGLSDSVQRGSGSSRFGSFGGDGTRGF